jgi:hypothetical protein
MGGALYPVGDEAATAMVLNLRHGAGHWPGVLVYREASSVLRLAAANTHPGHDTICTFRRE